VYTQLLQLQYQGCSVQLKSTPIKPTHADACSEHTIRRGESSLMPRRWVPCCTLKLTPRSSLTGQRHGHCPTGAVLEYATLPERFLSAQQRQRFAQHTPEPLRKLKLLDEQVCETVML